MLLEMNFFYKVLVTYSQPCVVLNRFKVILDVEQGTGNNPCLPNNDINKHELSCSKLINNTSLL